MVYDQRNAGCGRKDRRLIASILSFLTAVAGLFSRLLDWMQDKKAMDSIKAADRKIEEAREEHSKDKTDDAFDKDFWRD